MAAQLSPLRLPGFRYLFVATLGSSLGALLAGIALAIDVKDRTDSGLWVGAVLVVEFLPTIVVGLLLGPLLDRLDRRSLMIGADVVRAAVFAALPFAGSAAAVVGLALVAGLATGFFRPAVFAGVPNLVPEEQLPQANALLQTVENASWARRPGARRPADGGGRARRRRTGSTPSRSLVSAVLVAPDPGAAAADREGAHARPLARPRRRLRRRAPLAAAARRARRLGDRAAGVRRRERRRGLPREGHVPRRRLRLRRSSTAASAAASSSAASSARPCSPGSHMPRTYGSACSRWPRVRRDGRQPGHLGRRRRRASSSARQRLRRHLQRAPRPARDRRFALARPGAHLRDERDVRARRRRHGRRRGVLLHVVGPRWIWGGRLR